MEQNEVISRLTKLANYAVHIVGEEPYLIGLDDGIALHEAIDTLKSLQTQDTDCISRQDAIELFRKYQPYMAVRTIEFGNALKDLPSVQPEQRWIPCSERLPEESGQYYVSGGDKVWICEFLIIPKSIGGWCNDVSNPVVRAWMPPPSSWEGDSNG